MPTLLPYGLIKNDPGDESSTQWQPNDDQNIEHIDGHNHDGVNSAAVALTNMVKTSQTLLAADWVADGNQFRQEVTMPVGYTYLNSLIKFMVDDATDAYDNSEFYPVVQYTGASSFWIYTTDNTIGVHIIYV